MSGFWSAYVIVLTVLNILGCLWLLQRYSRRQVSSGGSKETTKHVWDGDLEEYNNPLPRWWLILFWLTAIFTAVYLAVYPGLGNFSGLTGWSQQAQYDRERARAEERFGAIFAAFAATPVKELTRNPEALAAGRNLYLNNCAVCHGADGRGARSFPDLTDSTWLYGGTPEAILETLRNGRVGVMPALGAALGEEGVTEVIAWMRTLEGKAADPALAAAGQQKYLIFCSACHGAEGKGMQALGAPDLTDGVWLHGDSDADLRDVINNGRVNRMPAQLGLLGEERLHVLAAYVLSLSGGGQDGGGG